MSKVRVNADAYARLVAAVAERPRSYKTIAEETGLHYTTVRDYINALHRHKQVHIAGWEKDVRGQRRVPLFLLGFGIDAAPERMTMAERQRAHRAREKTGTARPPTRRSTRPIINSVFALANGKPVKDDE
jgi:hypothetical protein